MTALTRRRFGWAMLSVAAWPKPSEGATRTWSVDIRRFSFAAERLSIPAGDRVVCHNRDLVPHTATAIEEAWDTGPIDPGQAAGLTFTAPARFEYYCLFHPQMRAVLEIVARQDNLD